MHFDSWHLRCTLAVSAYLCTSTRSFLARPVDDGLRLWIECVCVFESEKNKLTKKDLLFSNLRLVGQPRWLASHPSWQASQDGMPDYWLPYAQDQSTMASKQSRRVPGGPAVYDVF